MSSDERPKLALWRSVQLRLEQQIRDGSLPPGCRLPTEESLALDYGVHRHTIRRALARLRDKEFVRIAHGKGTFVAERALTYRVGKATRMTSAVLREGRVPRREVISSEDLAADRRIASRLSLPTGHPVSCVKTVRLVDEQPVSITTYHYPLPRFSGVAELIRATGSISEALKRFGVEKLSRNEMRIKACLPSAQEARALGIGRTKPLIELLSVNLDASGIPVQHVHGKLVSEFIEVTIGLGD